MDPVVKYLCRAAKTEPAIERIILFGSRARGDDTQHSDYDIAVDAPAFKNENWAAWAQKVRDEVPTLSGIDLVWMQGADSQTLLEQIALEGKNIYEKKSI